MWTYDGIMIHKKEGEYVVYASDEEALSIFANEQGHLRDVYIGELGEDVKEDGIYAAEVGYGPSGSMQDPGIYCVKFIGKFDWVADMKQYHFTEPKP